MKEFVGLRCPLCKDTGVVHRKGDSYVKKCRNKGNKLSMATREPLENKSQEEDDYFHVEDRRRLARAEATRRRTLGTIQRMLAEIECLEKLDMNTMSSAERVIHHRNL